MRLLSVSGMTTIFLTVPFLSQAFAQSSDWEVGPWGMHYMWGSFGIGMMFFMFVFWILVIAGAIAVVRWLWIGTGGSHDTVRGGESAEEVLRKRYARGEIDKEEFDSKLQDLRRT